MVGLKQTSLFTQTSVSNAGLVRRLLLCPALPLRLDSENLVLKAPLASQAAVLQLFLKEKLKQLLPPQLPHGRGHNLSSHDHSGGPVLCTMASRKPQLRFMPKGPFQSRCPPTPRRHPHPLHPGSQTAYRSLHLFSAASYGLRQMNSLLR